MKAGVFFLLLVSGCSFTTPGDVEIMVCILASCATEGAANTPTRNLTALRSPDEPVEVTP